jgi:hypothetical protein
MKRPDSGERIASLCEKSSNYKQIPQHLRYLIEVKYFAMEFKTFSPFSPD